MSTALIEFDTEASTLTTRAQAIGPIVDPTTYELKADLRVGANLLIKQIEEHHAPIKEAAFRAHKVACEQERKMVDPLKAVVSAIDGELRAWDREQERRRQEREREAQLAAQRQAEEDRLAEAAEAERRGDQATADALIASPVAAPPVVLPTETTKVAGLSKAKIWKFRITNAALLPREYLIPDEVAIGKVVKALKDKAVIPGVQVYSEDSYRGTGR